jgi:polar amino acid transport system permease protein
MPLDFSPVVAGWGDIAHGALVTVEVTAAALLLSCVLGLLIGIGRLTPKRRVVYGFCTAYLTFFRGTPLLVELFLLFFGLPQFGIQSVDRGQMEAARSIGMSSGQAMRAIILPQAVVRMIPPLGNEFIALIKNSALVSLLTIDDLMHEGQKIISVSYRSLEVYLVIALVYLVLTQATHYALHRIERHLRAGGMVQ